MIFALDTNVISCLLRPSKNLKVVEQFETAIEQGHDYVIPPLCYYEIMWYLLRKNAKGQLRVFNELYQNTFIKVSMGEDDFLLAAKIRADLDAKGLPIGNSDADIFIAAYCLVNDYTLVTDNIDHFARVECLELINWKV